jgi:hypothetical protein
LDVEKPLNVQRVERYRSGLKPHSQWCLYRSAEALRHPKSTYRRAEAVHFHNKTTQI